MTYYTDLTGQVAMLCLSMSLADAEAFVKDVDQERLTQTEYIAVLTAAAIRIGGCSKYDSADAFAAASRITERALENYDPKSGDQTLDVMGLVTEYMRYPPDSFLEGKVGEGMLSVFESWVDVWAGAESTIDADWNPDATFPPFEHPDVIDGQTPETVVNVEARAAYVRHLAKKQAFQARQRNQLLLRRVIDQYRDSYTAYAQEIPKSSIATDRLRALAGKISDKTLIGSMTR